MSLISWIVFVISNALRLLKNLWVDWGIQLLVAASLTCEIILAILGGRRKYMTSFVPRVIIWATYLLLSYIATIALGKLTVVRIDDPENPGDSVVLMGLLAPLLLMQLGYPDSIKAYAVEDNRLGLRQVLNITATVGVVAWILIRCWDGSSIVSIMFFPLFVVGIMKSAGWVWALQSVYDENSSVTAEDMTEGASIQRLFEEFPQDEKFKFAKDILKAYFRFDCLKPHLVNWLYHPLFISSDWMSIDSYTAGGAFSITEIELNFMFDVLYTKASVLYTHMGLINRIFGCFFLVSALCAFAGIFRSVFLIDMYVTYTYALLMAVTSLELYQLSMLAFSDWAVVKMSAYHKVPLVRRLLPFLAKQCMKQRRWSRSVGQLNLLDPKLLFEEFPQPVPMVLDWFEKREICWRYRLQSRQTITPSLKVLVVQKMADLDKKRNHLPYKKRGEWTLETHGIQENQNLKNSIETMFDKSIIIWHIATEILLKLETEIWQTLERDNSDAREGSKLLSDYMIYILALRPYMFSLTTADITLDYACCTLRPFLRYRDGKEAITILSSPDGDIPPRIQPSKETRITRDWNVLSDVRKLVVDLRRMENKWEIISSIWVEMLCYGAANSHPYHNAKLLRKGGELITHVWLLLAHKTDKYHSSIDELSKNLAAPTKSSSSAKAPRSCFQKMFGKVHAKNLYN